MALYLSTTNPLELRGLSKRTNQKNGKIYYVANLEDLESGEAETIYLGGELPPALVHAVKGQHFHFCFERNRYGNLVVTDVGLVPGT